MLSSKAKGILALVTSAFGFALMALCVRLCDDYGAPVSSFQKSFFRNAVALMIATVVFVRNRPVPRAALGRGVGRGAW